MTVCTVQYVQYSMNVMRNACNACRRYAAPYAYTNETYMFRLGGVGVRWEYGGMGISGGEERIVSVFFWVLFHRILC